MDVRLDSFNDFDRPAMAAGLYMFNGKTVVISPNVPKFHAADEIAPALPSRLFCFLFWLFDGRPPRPLRYRSVRKIEHEQVFEVHGKLFMSAAAWRELQRTIPPR